MPEKVIDITGQDTEDEDALVDKFSHRLLLITYIFVEERDIDWRFG